MRGPHSGLLHLLEGPSRTLADGCRVYFAMPEAPFGAMAEQTLVDTRSIIAPGKPRLVFTLR
ncbi:hypothetical protein ACOBR2_17920 [Telmatobacter bradus]|uniref:hypothetical protein n=1 Tax=Telmatobacter bradus TaxID=474953 RepID=UPI003B4339F7